MTDANIKQDLVSHQPFKGKIKRGYLHQPKFSIKEPGQVSRTVYCYKSLEEMKEKYPGAIIKELK